MHRITVDRHRAMVSVSADGFMTEAQLTLAADELHAAVRSLGDRVGRHVTLYDFVGLHVASAPVVLQFGQYFVDPRYRPLWAHKVALVSHSPLLRMQLNRVPNERGSIRVFDDRALAVAWLLEDSDERLSPAA